MQRIEHASHVFVVNVHNDALPDRDEVPVGHFKFPSVRQSNHERFEFRTKAFPDVLQIEHVRA